MAHAITMIRMSPMEKSELQELADRLGKNKSDLIRSLVHETLNILRERDTAAKVPPRRQSVHAESNFMRARTS